MKFTTIIAATIIAASALISCNKEGDTTKPIIVLHEPEDGEEFLPGSNICVEMDLSDDTAIASFEISIHNAFDGHHEHSKSETTTDDDNYNKDVANAFSFRKSAEELDEDINGLKNHKVHLHIPIDATAAYGDYHIMVYCHDAEGNESHIARNIAITEDAEDHNH